MNDETIAGKDPMAVIDPVWWCANFYGNFAEFERSLRRFSWPQRLVWAVLWYNSEVCNGGHTQFFSNSTGMLWPEALEGLEAIDREDLAKVLRAAAARFSRAPPRERAEREALLDQEQPDFSDLDTAHYAAMDGLSEAAMAYIRRQPEAFYFDDVIRKPKRTM